MIYAVSNVVVGAVVSAVADIRHNKEVLVDAERESQERHARALASFFREADREGRGALTWEEFKRYIENDEVSAFFHALDMDSIQARALFRMLDADRNGVVNLEELVGGCMHLKKE